MGLCLYIQNVQEIKTPIINVSPTAMMNIAPLQLPAIAGNTICPQSDNLSGSLCLEVSSKYQLYVCGIYHY